MLLLTPRTRQSAPAPYYAMVCRQSYFPLLADKLRQHFAPAALASMEELWLEARGVPLRWHLSAGTLFDLLEAGHDAHMPWDVTVHLTNFPEDRLLRLTPEALKAHFMSTLKEANFLKHGDGTKVMGLSRQDQDELWSSIGSGAAGFERFFAVNDKLLGEPADIRSVALRVLRADQSMLQRPLKPVREDGRLVTLGEALVELGVMEAGASAAVCVQGVCPLLETPLFEMQVHAVALRAIYKLTPLPPAHVEQPRQFFVRGSSLIFPCMFLYNQ